MEHSHVPYVVLLVKALAQWKSEVSFIASLRLTCSMVLYPGLKTSANLSRRY